MRRALLICVLGPIGCYEGGAGGDDLDVVAWEPPPATTGSDTSAGDDATDGGFIGTMDAPSECELYGSDCPTGHKCVPWSESGGTIWTATRCVAVAPDPQKAGQPCTVEGSPGSGIDDCDADSVCWYVDPDTLQGTCVAFCDNNGGCAGECEHCSVPVEDPFLCVADCDPVDPSCGSGATCHAIDGRFVCVPDISGHRGEIGDACVYANECDPGLVCVSAGWVPGCTGTHGCCSAYCHLDDPSGCTDHPTGIECVQLTVEAPPGNTCAPTTAEDLGLCVAL